MPAPIMYNPLQGLNEALEAAGGAIGERRKQARDLQRQQEGGDLLQRTLQELDPNASPLQVATKLSSVIGQLPPEMQKTAMQMIDPIIKGGVQQQQSDQLFNQLGFNQVEPEVGQQQQQASPQMGTTAGGLQAPLNQAAGATDPYPNVPDKKLLQLIGSPNKQESDIAKQIWEQRKQSRKQFTEDRKYASDESRKFKDEMEGFRSAADERQQTLGEIRYGLENRTPGQETKDWFASLFGRWGEGFLSPSGALIESAAKRFLLSDLGDVKGRPNQFLESMILRSLPTLGKSRESNEVILESLNYQQELGAEKLRIYDELTDYYNQELGFVPANISRIVDQNLAPFRADLAEKYAFKMRQIEEQNGDLSKMATQKVKPGTPLTPEMMTYMVDKYGRDDAKKRVKKLGYTVMSKDKYARYANESTG